MISSVFVAYIYYHYVCAQKKLRINTTDKRRLCRVFVCKAQSSGMKNISAAAGDRLLFIRIAYYYYGYRSTRRLYIFYFSVGFDMIYIYIVLCICISRYLMVGISLISLHFRNLGSFEGGIQIY